MQTTGARVLIVDDDAASRRLLEVRLRALECDVVTAADGRAALAALQQELPALMLVDLMMPGMSGLGRGRRHRVDVKDYRDRGAVARFMLGVLAGSDNMESAIELVEPGENRVVATSTVKSYNATAMGDMDLVAQLHAEEIVKYLQGVLGPGTPR